MLLRAGGVGVADWPTPFRYAHPDWAEQVRAFEPFIAANLSDREAWHALFVDVAYDDKGRLDRCRLAAFQATYGNRKTKTKKPPQPTGQLPLG